MGKYDFEIQAKLYEAKSADMQSVEASAKNLLSAYKELRSIVIVEISSRDVLKKLLSIKSEKSKEGQKKLFDDLISELQTNECNGNKITGLLNTIISNALYMGQLLCGVEEREMLDKVWLLYQEKIVFMVIYGIVEEKLGCAWTWEEK